MTTEELALLARNLPQAQSLDLYRLGQAIRMLYSEPKRVVAIRLHLHLGMMVRFLGSDANTFHTGRIVAMQDRGLTIDEPALNLRHSNIPYAAIDLTHRVPPVHSAGKGGEAAPSRPAFQHTERADFKIGDRVIFNDRNGAPISGTVSRVNQKTVTVVPDNRDGHWRVSPALLNHLVDI